MQDETLDDVLARVRLQNEREPLHASSKAARLAALCNDLELELLRPSAPPRTRELCLDVAAFALRILEQGD